MIPDGTYTAIVDRIEEELVALELSQDGSIVGEQVVEAAALPEAARQPDAVLEVELTDGELTAASYDEEATQTRSQEAQDRFDRLSSRPPRDDDDDEE